MQVPIQNTLTAAKRIINTYYTMEKNQVRLKTKFGF